MPSVVHPLNIGAFPKTPKEWTGDDALTRIFKRGSLLSIEPLLLKDIGFEGAFAEDEDIIASTN
jgi:hypothetical protein